MSDETRAAAASVDDERCQRCDDPGPDLRTLWMACFYAMEELRGVPFDQVQVRGTVHPRTGDRPIRLFDRADIPPIQVPVYADAPLSPEAAQLGFYRLRVCKACRGEWMAAIAAWFDAPRERDGDACNYVDADGNPSRVYVRRHGAARLATREEIAALEEATRG